MPGERMRPTAAPRPSDARPADPAAVEAYRVGVNTLLTRCCAGVRAFPVAATTDPAARGNRTDA